MGSALFLWPCQHTANQWNGSRPSDHRLLRATVRVSLDKRYLRNRRLYGLHSLSCVLAQNNTKKIKCETVCEPPPPRSIHGRLLQHMNSCYMYVYAIDGKGFVVSCDTFTKIFVRIYLINFYQGCAIPFYATVCQSPWHSQYVGYNLAAEL